MDATRQKPLPTHGPNPANLHGGWPDRDRARDENGLPPRDSGVCARGLSKLYRSSWTLKSVEALIGLDLDVVRGEVFGYLGPNGAGKTTTLKLLTGLHKPTSGRAWLLGVPIEETTSRARIGFLPEHPYFYDYLNGIEYLEFAARLSGLSGQDASEQAKHWMGRVGLGDRSRVILRKYSKGMLQRIGLAAALVHRPELLILDEPMSGLDPFGRRDVRELILEQRAIGTTVLFSSHILPDVEQICDRVAILLRGRLTRVATVHELVQAASQKVEIRCAGDRVLEAPSALRNVVVRRERAHEVLLEVQDERQLGDVLAWLVQARVEVRSVTPQRATLEDLFIATAEESAIGYEQGERRSA